MESKQINEGTGQQLPNIIKQPIGELMESKTDLAKALKRLGRCKGDDERYHVTFDEILEERLMELDPKWMTVMKNAYEKSGMARWCA